MGVGGRPRLDFQERLAQGQPATLLGFPVTMAEDMPALAAGSLSLAFGRAERRLARTRR